MRYMIFTSDEQDRYKVALLIKNTHFLKRDISEYFIQPLSLKGVITSDIIAIDLAYYNNKVTASQTKTYLLNEVLPTLKELGVTHIYCADAHYCKTLIKQTNIDRCIGYTYDCALPGFEYLKIIPGVSHGSLIYNPNNIDKLNLSIQTLTESISGTLKAMGEGIIHYEDYPHSHNQIEWTLNRLHQYPQLFIDTETFSLNVNYAGLASIAFSWSEHEGCAFLCDYVPHSEGQMSDKTYGFARVNAYVRIILAKFFESYKGNIKFHNATYDAKVLIRALWMKDPLDRVGMLHGLHTLFRNLDDTKIITYLATNSTAGNVLGLKDLAHEFAGNWAEDNIKNVLLIPPDNLLKYNLRDVLSTAYVFRKYYPIMLRDKQEDIYRTIMLPSLKVITQMELIGLPVETSQVKAVRKELEQYESKALNTIHQSIYVEMATTKIRESECTKANSKLKTKQKTIADFEHITFNPGSGSQLAVLLFEVMGLPVIDRTPTKAPATSADVLEKLLNHTKDPDKSSVIQALLDVASVAKILNSFIPAFEAATSKADGRSYVHGCFNLGGTVSGRLSSNSPNLHNLPSGSTWGKLVKTCVSAPQGQLFCSADFASLEDRINTLLTKDSNKLKVYTDGYDGHCLRAFYYFKSQMPDIVKEFAAASTKQAQVDVINSIKKRYPDLRQDSKAPTFALTYAGMWMTLMKNCGFTETMSKQIEKNYHELYRESDEWMAEQVAQCCVNGYATVAFGLRIRTPLLKKTVLGTSKTPREAEAEARSVGNAIGGQSYGLLNSRAANEFMQRVWESEYKYDIVPVSQIHDAIYILVKDDINVLTWANHHLTECMAWNELPEIQHPEITLSAELDVHFPNWASAITLPNTDDATLVKQKCMEWYAKQQEKIA